jgi:hypothetical protein
MAHPSPSAGIRRDSGLLRRSPRDARPVLLVGGSPRTPPARTGPEPTRQRRSRTGLHRVPARRARLGRQSAASASTRLEPAAPDRFLREEGDGCGRRRPVHARGDLVLDLGARPDDRAAVCACPGAEAREGPADVSGHRQPTGLVHAPEVPDGHHRRRCALGGVLSRRAALLAAARRFRRVGRDRARDRAADRSDPGRGRGACPSRSTWPRWACWSSSSSASSRATS